MKINDIIKEAGEVPAPAPVARPALNIAPGQFPAATTPLAAEGDSAEMILDKIAASPEIEAFIDANTVRNAEGDVDLAATIGQISTKASAEMDIPGLKKAWEEASVVLDNFESTPEGQAMSPEERADYRAKLPEIKQALVGLIGSLEQMQNTFAQGGKQMTDLSKTQEYKDNGQGKMKGYKTLVPSRPAATPAPVSESADDKLLQTMLTIAGIK